MIVKELRDKGLGIPLLMSRAAILKCVKGQKVNERNTFQVEARKMSENLRDEVAGK